MGIARKSAVISAGVAMASGLFAGVGGLSVAGAAPAAAQGTTCTKASSTDTITPGLLFTTNGPQSISGTLKASGCTPVGSPPATSVSGSLSLSSTDLTCLSGSAAGTFSTKANNGMKSKGTLTLAATSTPLKFTLSGKVTSGFLKGSAIKGTFTATPVTGTCSAGSPLTKVTVKNNGKFTL